MQSIAFIPTICLVLATTTTNFAQDSKALLGEIGKSEFAGKELLAAIDVLRNQIASTQAVLPQESGKLFDKSLLSRLRQLQNNAAEYKTPEYKNAFLAKRILELAEHALIVSNRAIPNASQSDKSREQYSELLSRLETAPRIDSEVKEIATKPVFEIL